MSTATSPADVRRTSTVTIMLLAGVYIIDYIDRVAIAVALPFLGVDLGLDKTQQGLAVSAFAIAYMLAQLPGGVLADRFGSRPLLIISLLAWSVFTAATGLVEGLVSLIIVRALFGVAQALFPGASFKALAERTTPAARNRSAGFMLSANAVGAGIGPLVMAPLIVWVGWRHGFWIIALGGAILGVLMWRFLPSPLRREVSNDAATPESEVSSWQLVVRNSVVWRYALLFCCFNMLTYGMITWVPSYLYEVRGLSLVAAGVSSAVPLLVTAVSTILGGWLMSRYFDGRAKLFIVPVLLIASIILVLMLRTSSTTTFTILQACAMGCSGLALMGIIGMPLRALPRECIGSGMGIVNTGGQVAGVLAPVIMGWLAQDFGYTVAFGFLAATTAAAAMVALLTPSSLNIGPRPIPVSETDIKSSH
ncbi:MAG: MFS transporter [Rhodococcus sp. (in: high G+C Gram-positive bacteria)]|uniref:MFS transporter n=1 Tax=Rhodococcus sp. EPR-157 TaxID=1813677 RepID=UPI0007BB74AC|nr:MFS transporter [Rhodococcus sp. EPR-157]KZF06562.1 MFS transporter [Rhodococcus sp. EPR-157]